LLRLTLRKRIERSPGRGSQFSTTLPARFVAAPIGRPRKIKTAAYARHDKTPPRFVVNGAPVQKAARKRALRRLTGERSIANT